MDFDEIKHNYQKRLRGYIGSKVRNDEDAEDVAAITWVRIWNARGNFDPNIAGVWTWITRYANWCIKDYWKGKLNEPTHQNENEWDQQPYHQINQNVNPFVHFELMPKCIGREMGYPWQLIVFGLKVFVGYTPSEIVNDFMDNHMVDVLHELMDQTKNSYRCGNDQIKVIFESLLERMNENAVSQVLPGDAVTREMLVKRELEDKLVRNIKLSDLCGNNSKHTVSDWCNKVMTRIRCYYENNGGYKAFIK